METRLLRSARLSGANLIRYRNWLRFEVYNYKLKQRGQVSVAHRVTSDYAPRIYTHKNNTACVERGNFETIFRMRSF